MRPARSSALTLAAGGLWWNNAHRRSTAVRQWRPSRVDGRRVGDLHVRSAGSGDPVIVLLHGLVATGDIFGKDFDALACSGVLVVPDLLGFGRSLDETRSVFEPDEHLNALDQMLIDLGLDDRPLVIGAHSMGAALALRWSARRGSQVERIVCWGAPVYRDANAVDDALAGDGLMIRVLATNSRWAELACHLSCRHRSVSGWVAAALAPSMPVPIARASSLHTWPAYRDAMDHLITKTDWTALSAQIAANGTTLDFVWGDADPIGDTQYAQQLNHIQVRIVEGGGHHLPMTHGRLCVSEILSP